MQKVTAFLLLATVVLGVCLAGKKTQLEGGKDKVGYVSDKANPMHKQIGKPDGQNGGQMGRGNESEAVKPSTRGCKCEPGRRGHGQRRGEGQMDGAGGARKGQQEGVVKRSIIEGGSQMGQSSQGKGNRQRTNGNRGASQRRPKDDHKGDRNGCKCGPRGGRGGRRQRGNKGKTGSRRDENKDKKIKTEG